VDPEIVHQKYQEKFPPLPSIDAGLPADHVFNVFTDYD
jgi:hypothetical protein